MNTTINLNTKFEAFKNTLKQLRQETIRQCKQQQEARQKDLKARQEARQQEALKNKPKSYLSYHEARQEYFKRLTLIRENKEKIIFLNIVRQARQQQKAYKQTILSLINIKKQDSKPLLLTYTNKATRQDNKQDKITSLLLDYSYNKSKVLRLTAIDLYDLLKKLDNKQLQEDIVKIYIYQKGVATCLLPLINQGFYKTYTKKEKKILMQDLEALKEYKEYNYIDPTIEDINQELDQTIQDKARVSQQDNNIDIKEDALINKEKKSSLYRQDFIKATKKAYSCNSKEYKKALETALIQLDKRSLENSIYFKDLLPFIVYLLIKKPQKHYLNVIKTYNIPLQELFNQVCLKLLSKDFLKRYKEVLLLSKLSYYLGMDQEDYTKNELLSLINYTVRNQIKKLIRQVTLPISVSDQEYLNYTVIKKLANNTSTMQAVDHAFYSKKASKFKLAIKEKRQLLASNTNKTRLTSLDIIESSNFKYYEYKKEYNNLNIYNYKSIDDQTTIQEYDSLMDKIEASNLNLYFNKKLDIYSYMIINNKKVMLYDYLKGFKYLKHIYIDGFTQAKIASIYQVNKASVSKGIKREKKEALPTIRQFLQYQQQVF